MRYESSDQLFHDLSDSEAEELCQWAEDVVLRGRIAYPRPAWVDEWLTSMGFDDRQALLFISTALPQRVLLSVVRHYRENLARGVYAPEG